MLNRILIYSYLFLSNKRFHTREQESAKRTCALCLGNISEDSPNPKVCVQCSERHNIRQGLNQLMGRAEDTRYDCPRCDEMFAAPAQLHDHLRAEHPIESPSGDSSLNAPTDADEVKSHGCRFCPLRFHDKEDLDEHVVMRHAVEEVIKQEREDSSDAYNGKYDDDDNCNKEMNGIENATDKNSEGEEGGEGEPSSQGDTQSVVNVESEIKIDNDSYATVFYCLQYH